MNNSLIRLIISSSLLILISSCVNTKSATYFIDQNDAEIKTVNQSPKATIQSSDLLSIHVTSMSAQPNIFNSLNASVNSSINTSNNYSLPSTGYLVDKEGNIKLPYIGKLKVEGLSNNELEEIITNEILSKKLMIDPIVTIRHLNFKITVLGEVGHPMVINVPNERISILEALGMAGDLTIYAKRNNVLLIREENGKKITRRIDLNSNQIFSSPYYYLKTNDVIYVEPNNAKIASTSRSRQILPMVFGALSFGVVVIDRLIK